MYLYNFENHINSTAINYFTCNYNFTNQLYRLFLARPIVDKVILGIHSCPIPPTNTVKS